MFRFVKEFRSLEAASGILLMLVAAIAMLAANSPFAHQYEALLSMNLWFAPVELWINDGLMTLFFLLVGLEIKRECVEGELSTRPQATLPVLAALGGVITPAIVFAWFNQGLPTMRGWAIPTATDIAFSLGVLALFGSRINPSLKIFLMALAIIDDLAAVLIIAIFYTDDLAFEPLFIALICTLILFMVNRRNSQSPIPYLIGGIILWLAVLKSGVHATVAGVILGFLIPVEGEKSLGERVIDALHPWVAYGIVPLFAFVNAGVMLAGITLEQAMQPLPLGIAVGLFLGKQLGIFATSWLVIRLRWAAMPAKTTWLEFYAVCIIAGIGFTMSLFIGTLAFGNEQMKLVRFGVIIGSLLSALIGYALLYIVAHRKGYEQEA